MSIKLPERESGEEDEEEEDPSAGRSGAKDTINIAINIQCSHQLNDYRRVFRQRVGEGNDEGGGTNLNLTRSGQMPTNCTTACRTTTEYRRVKHG